MSLLKRIAIAFSLGLFIGINIAMSNGLSLPAAIRDGLIFSLIITFTVILITWGINIAAEKKYPLWIGFVLVLVLNIIGIIILLLLPKRIEKESAP